MMRRVVVLAALAAACVCAWGAAPADSGTRAAATASRLAPASWFGTVNLVGFEPGSKPYASFDAPGTQGGAFLRSRLGITSVALIPILYVKSLHGSDIVTHSAGAHPNYTASPSTIESLAHKAERDGLGVVIRPWVNIWVPHGAAKAPPRVLFKPASIGHWWAQYRSWMLRYAAVAAAVHAKAFDVGVELSRIQGSGYTARWRSLIAAIRREWHARGYAGQLIYSSNLHSVATVRFWNALDLIGVDYYNTTPEPAVYASLAAVQAGTRTKADPAGRRVVFTEFGYPNTSGRAQAHHLGVGIKWWYDAYTATSGDTAPWFAGFWFYDWFSNQGKPGATGGAYDGFDLKSEPARKAICGWYCTSPER